jgi:hypothetical protein
MSENLEQTEQPQNPAIDYAAPVGQPTDVGNYEPMKPANPRPREELLPEETFGADKLGLESAAQEVLARRQPTKDELQAQAPVERAYQKMDTGERVKSSEAVDPLQAAHDLQLIRDQEKAVELAAVEELLRNQVDGQQTTENLGVAETPLQEPIQEQPQPAVEQQQSGGIDPEVVKLIESNPKLQAALRAELEQRDAYAAHMQQQAQQAVTAAGQVAIANVLASFPELANVPVGQLETALQVMQANNPERAAAARSHLEHVQRMAAQVEQNRQQQVAAQEASFRQFAKQNDDAYDKFVETIAPGRSEEISKNANALLTDLGFSKEAVAREWNSNPLFRSAQGQAILALAAQQWAARKVLPTKLYRQVPTVQRPGSGQDFIQSSEFEGQREALARLDKSGSAKDAARYLSLKRANASRR